LSGRIDLQARVKLGFFKKTFRKKLADWPGIGPIPFDFVGGEIPLTSPVGMTFGEFGEDSEYVDPTWLDQNLQPPQDPAVIDVPGLGAVCLEIPK
jgi:hypothetical protein